MSNVFTIKHCTISDNHSIPYVEVDHGNGPVILVTAGMDGDEYVGIEAAWRLCRQLSGDASLTGRIIIFPVVNIHGNNVGISTNPLDNKYPKHLFPGRTSGSSSEQLIDSLLKTVRSPIDLWIDLHGGSSVEELQPFVWGFSYGDTKTRHKSNQILSHLKPKILVQAPWYKARDIMNNGTVYIVLESGQRGVIEEDAINQHMSWVTTLLHRWNDTETDVYQYYTTIRYYTAPHTGYWQLKHREYSIPAHSDLGAFFSLRDSHKHTYQAKKEGIFLWRHIGGWVKQGDILYAVGEGITS